MESNPTIMMVVAGSLRRADGCWLMHKRPAGKQHGGLWEFPGGKVEPAETPVNALVRELNEELLVRVEPANCVPAAFAETPAGNAESAIVILLYTIADWEGEPVVQEGGELAWIEPALVADLAMPPLDRQLYGQMIGQSQGIRSRTGL